MRKKCEAECGQYLQKACEKCEHNPKNIPRPSLWFQHIHFLCRLRKAGFPFEADDLSLDEWLGVGELIELVEAKRKIL